MSTTTENRAQTSTAWQLEFVRLIAFPETPPLLTDEHWWQDVVSGQPDDFVSTRKKHTREDRGSYQGAVLALTVDLGRVEWLAQPAGDSGELPGRLPTLGPLRDKVEWFVRLLSPWLANSCPPLVRLAFAAKLLCPAATQREAFETLGRLLPAVNLRPYPNDFLYQVNRRRESAAAPGWQLNRISSWSKLNIAPSIESPAGTPFRFRWREECYSALELDINTAPEMAGVLPRESLAPLFQELASRAVEIAERGDVPEEAVGT